MKGFTQVKTQIVADVERFDKKQVMMESYKCDVFLIDNEMKTGKKNSCTGCEGIVQCCKTSCLMTLWISARGRAISEDDFYTAVNLILKDCKTDMQVKEVLHEVIPDNYPMV